MTLINVKAFKEADKYNYTIPAANFINQEMLEAYRNTEETNKPLIIAFAEAHSKYISMEKAALLGKFYAENSRKQK